MLSGSGVCAAGLVFPLLALWAASPVWRYLAVFGALTAATAFAIYGLALPRRTWRREDELARFVGLQVTPIASDLLSSVQLAEPSRDADRFSPQLVNALVDATAQRVAALSPEVLVPSRALRRPALLFGCAVLSCCALALTTPTMLAAGWRALIASPLAGPFEGAQMSAAPLVGDVEIRLTFPEYTGRPPVTLPAASGDFRAMPGAVAEIRTSALGDVTRAEIVFGGGDPSADGETTRPVGDAREPLVLDISGRTLSGTLTVTEETTYRFLLERPGGERDVESSPRTIEVEPDSAPTVELHAPADELDVAARKRIELAYLAEDDYGITKAELVWTEQGKQKRIAVLVPEPGRRSAQSKFLWDLADMSLTPGLRVAYHLEVFDNDDVTGPNVGRSRTFALRVFSERERHESLIGREKEMFEHMVRLLGARLTLPVDDLAAHHAVSRDTASVVVELGTVIAALGNDKLVTPKLVQSLDEMRSRIDKLARKEAKLLAKLDSSARGPGDKLGPPDKALVAELEDDVIALADWLDRQQMENLLAITDEIATHQDRIKKLLEEYKRTGSEEIKAELERELRALERRLTELRERRLDMPEDVLDQFVNADAIPGDRVNDCLGEVKALLDAGDVDRAVAKMEECSGALSESAQALERALDALRDDKFSEQQKKLDQQMSELADAARDQQEIADDADDVYHRYAERAAELMKGKASETRRNLQETIDKLKGRLAKIPEPGLTPFSKEELAVVKNRIDDLEKMLADGDVAESLSMARQTEASLEMMEAELAANLDEDSMWNEKTPDAHRQVRKAQPLAQKLVEELQKATPSPRDILSADDRRELDKLRRRQAAALGRVKKLAQKAQDSAKDMPGNAGEVMGKQLGEAAEHMKNAEQRMRAQDPSGARQQAREAATRLQETRRDAQNAARMAQREGRAGLRDEPVRIPGAEEYRAPQAFREDLLEAMKKDAPSGFQDMVRRYYEELVK